MDIIHYSGEVYGDIRIGGSKSESNRWLILQKLYPTIKEIENLSDAEDTQLLKKALNNDGSVIDIHHAGTAMRFLTAYFSLQSGRDITLTGSERMQQRPIAPLVEALQNLGADIHYLKRKGFPPLQIKGGNLSKGVVDIVGDISSQYISALMLIAPKLLRGLKINFKTELTSLPYIEMTMRQLMQIGVRVERSKDSIKVFHRKKVPKMTPIVESDWSSASYWYSMAALSSDCDFTLSHYNINSLQGDAKIVNIFEEYFGIVTYQREGFIRIRKAYEFTPKDYIEIDLKQTPDIAQTIAVTCAGLQTKAKLTGLHTLKIKETDRLVALQKELNKIGVETIIGEDFIEIIDFKDTFQTPVFDTYNDHRMAMSLAPLALRNKIEINRPEVVGKSYPNFWKDLEKAGFNIQ